MTGSFWKRNKRKIVAAVAVGAAGAAAAYWWWQGSEEDDGAAQQQQQPQGQLLSRFGRSKSQAQALHTLREIHDGPRPGGAQGGGGAQSGATGGEEPSSSGGASTSALDESLQGHFNSIQALSDRQALDDLLPRLRDVLMQATDYEPLREQLKEGGLSSEAKQQLWQQLAQLSFMRAMGAVWLVPLLDLLVRMKLHIVGRHLYLESKLAGIAPRGGGGGGGLGGCGGGRARMQMPPRLSDRAKEEFFRSDYFIDVGSLALLQKLGGAVAAVLRDVNLGSQVVASDVERLMIEIHATFEGSFSRGEDSWHAYLLPPGQQPINMRTANGVDAFMSPIEAAMVDELNGELYEVAAEYRFVEALRAAVRHTSKVTGSYVATKMDAPPGGGPGGSSAGADASGASGSAAGAPAPPKPFPFVVPLVAKSSQLLFDEAYRCTKGISSLREVQALCASAFTFGPHIC